MHSLTHPLHTYTHERVFADTCLCLTGKRLPKRGEIQLDGKQSEASARGGGGNLPVAEVNSTEIPRELQAWKGGSGVTCQ